MSKKVILFVLVLTLLVGSGYWALHHFSRTRSEQLPSSQPTKQPFPPPRQSQKSTKLDAAINTLQERLKARPDDGQAYYQLASAYLRKVREVGHPTYYTKTEALLQQALELDPGNVEGMSLMGALCLAQHQFRDALTWGERAKAISPNSFYAYGVISDAHVELGNYEQAIDSLQQMVNLRPDLSSYSRVSHMRQLMGDIEGAIEVMNMAINAGRVGTEPRAWCLTQLGHLYFSSGKLDLAEAEYQKALIEFPNYVHPLAGQARVQAAYGNYSVAISRYRQVVDIMPSPEYVIALGDVYRVSGEIAKAEQQYALVRVIAQLYQSNGVDTNLELALFDADHDQNLPEALRRARQAFEARPSIYAADVLAWTLYKMGRYAEAYDMSRQALRLGTKDALLHFHRGIICKASGALEEARDYLEQALVINPHFSVLYAKEAARTLQALHSDDSLKTVLKSKNE